MLSDVNDEHVTAIQLHTLIVHKVDHKNFDQPVLADLTSTISEEVGSFIRRHIVRNRRHKNASTARYREGNRGNKLSVCHLADQILADNETFVQNTRQIAELLFFAQQKRNTSPGELVFCTFSDGSYNHNKWIAIMKMDPEDGFVGREERVGEQIRIVLEKVKDVLPTGELQKCAFILPTMGREEAACDLVVLDQQPQYLGGTRQVASYFLHEFLGAERDLTNRDLTRGFLQGVNRWAEDKFLIGDWTLERTENLKRAAIETVKNQRLIDIPAFINQQLDNELEEDSFLQELTLDLSKAGRVTNLVFPPDPELQVKLTKVRKYRGDHELEVRVKIGANVPDDLLTHEFDRATQTHIITIRTTEWKEV
jgi:hypothetical protein